MSIPDTNICVNGYQSRSDAVMFAVPNGGARSRIEAAIMRGTGTLAGAPDIVAVKDGRFLALELKRPGGRASVNQIAVLAAIEAAGGTVAIADNLDDALHVLEGWGVLRGRCG